MISLSNLEVHAWHGCNLSCESCSHYSSLGLKGGPTVEELATWMGHWSGRLRPRTFSILGGEPTLNRELAQIVRISGEMWPHSRIRVATNGFLLPRHRELALALSELGERAILEVSSHHGGQDFQERFEKVRQTLREWVAEFGIQARVTNSDRNWTRRYHANDRGVAFGDGVPRLAWKNCIGKFCRQLFDGKLWKCPPIAYFDLLAAKVNIEESWRALAHRYHPLEPGCSEQDLISFLAMEEQEVCRLCPSKPERFDLPNPIRTGKRRGTPGRSLFRAIDPEPQ
jgi:hypothetical protein